MESGCIEIRLFSDKNNPGRFFGFERWENHEALDNHREQLCTQKIAELINTALISPVEVLNLKETKPAPVPLNARKRPAPEDDVFVIFFIFKIKDDYRKRLIERFEEHVDQSRKETGNLLFDLYTVDGADDTLVVYEHWRNESALWDIHFKQPYSEITGKLMQEAVVGDMNGYMNFVDEIG